MFLLIQDLLVHFYVTAIIDIYIYIRKKAELFSIFSCSARLVFVCREVVSMNEAWFGLSMWVR